MESKGLIEVIRKYGESNRYGLLASSTEELVAERNRSTAATSSREEPVAESDGVVAQSYRVVAESDPNKNTIIRTKNKNKSTAPKSPKKKTIVDDYHDLYLETFGIRPNIGKKEPSILHRLVKTHGAEAIRKSLELYLNEKDKFVQDAGYPLELFEKNLNKYRLRIRAPTAEKPTRSREEEIQLLEKSIRMTEDQLERLTIRMEIETRTEPLKTLEEQVKEKEAHIIKCKKKLEYLGVTIQE